ncbi:hypothetical protein [Chloroflexus sp.]|uniref:hypothetical protein n=1 Tax=Chloroflexus sp. TaxID=1904827 RepID=UPI00260A16D1|nr:hypothetical protein [uncultured Chloroflexus sp.]
MRNGNFEQYTVEEVLQTFGAEARALLRENRIDRSNLRFADACAAASITPDEFFAQLDAGMRRRATRFAGRAVAEHA